MIIVINAGGSGTRLWPLSTPEYPKHLLKLTGERTLLQSAYDRAVKLTDTIYVVTEASHADHVKQQLPKLPDEAFLIEPGRRGTAHCIVFALDAIARKHSHDEAVAFIHSDHHIRDTEGFARSLTIAARLAEAEQRITLIGIKPTQPATAFGYIERDGAIDINGGVYKVESFKEKPDYETALEYVSSGRYLWNCGYFVGTTTAFLNEMEKWAPDLKANYDRLAAIADNAPHYAETYLSFDNQVIDIALIEKAKDLAVVAASFDWLDVGSYKDLHDAVSKDKQRNYFKGDSIYPVDVENVYVRNEEEKPVTVIGLDNVVVVNTPDGLLVARKDVSHRVGEIAKQLQTKEQAR